MSEVQGEVRLRPPLVTAPFLLPCSRCGAESGDGCVTGQGRKAAVHKERVQAMQAENRQRLRRYTDALTPLEFLRMAAEGDHDAMCLRRVGIAECDCLCVVARTVLENIDDGS